MSYLLVGSNPSPFVRRIRMAMENIPYEFKALNIYEEAGAQEIHKLNPTNQIPCLIDGEQPIWDSRIILQYLSRKHHWTTPSLDEENRMTAIERMMDAGVGIFMLRKSDVSLDSFYGKRLVTRVDSVMEWLTPWMKSDEAKKWTHTTLTLYCALDWMLFRDVHPAAKSQLALNFLSIHQNHPAVQSTDPRKN
ncbi:MAG: glutathione S-transferase family protein [Bacteriovoracaceae bacterium]|nr:glutathione S-transferase family protein [Bacteriovoracaceae bacterium]